MYSAGVVLSVFSALVILVLIAQIVLFFKHRLGALVMLITQSTVVLYFVIITIVSTLR